MGKVFSWLGFIISVVLMIAGGLALCLAFLGALCIPFKDAYYLLAENVWPSALRMAWDGAVLGGFSLAFGYFGYMAATGDKTYDI